MGENVIKSEKINFNKVFKLAWIVVAILLIVVIIIYLSKYSTYKKIQDKAVELTLSITDKFDYAKDRNSKLQAMFNHYKKYERDGCALDSALKKAFSASGDSVSSFMNSLWGAVGKGWFYCSNFFVYFWIHLDRLFVQWSYLAGLLLLITLYYIIDRENEIVISENKVICNHGKKITKEFLVKDIKSVELAGMKGLKIRGNGVSYKISFVKNRDEVKSVIMDKLTSIPEEKIVTITQEDSADSIAKYKKLLDSGAITQEEFEAKKKQLLGV